MIDMASFLQTLLEMFTSVALSKGVDQSREAIRQVYDPMIRTAARLTGEELRRRYGDNFIETWGSLNFIESLPLSGPEELEKAIQQCRKGRWEPDRESISESVREYIRESAPAVSSHVDEFVDLFLSNFISLLRDDLEAILRRVFVLQESIVSTVNETFRGVQRLEARWSALESRFMSVPISHVEVALRDALATRNRDYCKEVLTRCELLIARHQYEEARSAAQPIEGMVLATEHNRLIARYYNLLGQVESWGGARVTPDAGSYLIKAASYLPDDPIISVNLGGFYLNTKELEKVRESLARVPEQERNFANYHNLTGLLEVSEGNKADAERSFKRAVLAMNYYPQ